MKTNQLILTSILFLSIYFNGDCQNATTPEKLLGEISKNDLTTGVFDAWFKPQFDAYKPDAVLTSELKNNVKDYEILVFMGTWCGDSKQEVPRFYKVLESLEYPMQKLKVIAVDNDKNKYKQSPTGEEKGLNIHRVPTFIFYKNGKEINRIIEHPKVSFEADINTIISSNLYEPNYNSVELLNKLLNQKSADQILNSSEILEQLKPLVKNENDFNSFGYMNLNAKNYEKAITIFTLNNKLFPNNYNTFDSLAEAYQMSGNNTLALKNYEFAYGLIMQNPIIISLQEKIETLKKQ